MLLTRLGAGLACWLYSLADGETVSGAKRNGMENKQGSLKACHRKTPVKGWRARTPGTRTEKRVRGGICPRVLPAQEGCKVAHPLVPATTGCRAVYRQLLGSGRACVTGSGRAEAEPRVRVSSGWPCSWSQVGPCPQGSASSGRSGLFLIREAHSEPSQYRP